MSRRLFPWRSKPSEAEEEIFARAAATHMLVVNELGPTQFIIKEAESPTKNKVQVGERQLCACNKNKSAPLCIHIAFVMLKVLRVAQDNPLLWQYGLIESEVNDLLAQRFASRRARQAPQPAASQPSAATAIATGDDDAKTQANGPPAVVRRPVKPDEDCPICQEPLVPPSSSATTAPCDDSEGVGSPRPLAAVTAGPLCWCSLGCGNSLHARCMLVWAQHRVSVKERISCPLCRNEWPDGTVMSLRTLISQWERKKKKREEAAQKRQQMIEAGIDPDHSPPPNPLQTGALVPLTGVRAVGGATSAMNQVARGSNIHSSANSASAAAAPMGFGIAGVGIAGLTLAGVPTVRGTTTMSPAQSTSTLPTASSAASVASGMTSNPYQTPLRVGSMPPSPSSRRTPHHGKLHSAVGAFRRSPAVPSSPSSGVNEIPFGGGNGGNSTPKHSATRTHRRPAHGSVIRNQIEQFTAAEAVSGDGSGDHLSMMVGGAASASPSSVNDGMTVMSGRDPTLDTPPVAVERRRRTAPPAAAFGRSLPQDRESKESKYGGNEDEEEKSAVNVVDLAIGNIETTSSATGASGSDTPQPHLPRHQRKVQRMRQRAPLQSTAAAAASNPIASSDIAPLLQPGHMIGTEERVARVAPHMGRLRLPPRHSSKNARAAAAALEAATAGGARSAAAAASSSPSSSLTNALAINASSTTTAASTSGDDTSPSNGSGTRAASGTLFKGRTPLRSLVHGVVSGVL